MSSPKAKIIWLHSLFQLLTSVNSVSAAPPGGGQSAPYVQPTSKGIKLQNGFERVYIQPYGEHGFRVRASLLRDPTGSEPSALLDPPIEGPGGGQGLAHDITLVNPFLEPATIRNGNLIVKVTNGTISFHRVEGQEVSLSPDDSELGEDGLRTTLLLEEFTDTKTLPARYYRQDFRTSSFYAEFSFRPGGEGELESSTGSPQEQVYGVGQQPCCRDHSVNKKGQVVDFVNFNSQVRLPVYMSNKGYLQFFNMPSEGRLEFGTQRTRFVTHEATVVDYYITTAPPGDYDSLQKQYTAVTGRQPIPPEFMLGYQQSKLRYYNQTQVIELAQKFHDEQVNVSLIVVDFFAWKFQGDWSFNPQYWPDPAHMASEVKRLTGAEMMVSLWPSVEDLSENYLTLQRNGLLATTRDGPGVQDSFEGVYTRLVDSTNPAAREFLWRRLNDSYFSKGIRNFWIDQADGGTLGEPFENNGQVISNIPYARSFAQYFIGTQEATGKMYPWLHQQAIEEGLNNLTNGDAQSQDAPQSNGALGTTCQYMSLTRSTFAGGQRFCSYLWSGDTDSRFDVLLQQITAGASVAASGISSWTLDIGGFAGLDIESEAGRELFVRWLAMGVFLPYMRVHGTRMCSTPRTDPQPHANPCPNEPWSYGDDNFTIIKKYIALRYQLIPYVKQLFKSLQATGRAIMRPLYWDFSTSDPFVVNATAVNDPRIVHQYMFGPRLLVAPVGTLGAKTKEVYLPRLPESLVTQHSTWTYWWSEKEFGRGGQFAVVEAGLDEIPVFYLGNKQDILSGDIDI